MEFNRRRASPPPVFEFLRDAEEKLVQRRESGEEDAQFITLVVDENLKEDDNDGYCFSSSHSHS